VKKFSVVIGKENYYQKPNPQPYTNPKQIGCFR